MEKLNVLDKKKVKELFMTGEIKSHTDVLELNKILFKELMESMLEAEMDDHLGYEKHEYKAKKTDNSRNGTSAKTVRAGDLGEVPIEIPRDRKGEFEPILIPKYEKNISGLEEKIISMYAKGMTQRDIESHLNDIYGISLSHTSISNIIEKIMPVIKEWQSRPLNPIYSFIFLDAIHYNVRSEGTIVTKAAYVVVGIDISGKKEVIGIYVGENESSKYWLTVLNDMKNRGLQDILIASTDGLTGFKEAIKAAFPKTEVQRCIVHQIRNSMRFVSYKDIKEFVTDLKTVYSASKEEIALDNLIKVKEKWGKKYSTAIKSLENNWDTLSSFFKYDNNIRKIMYTTNIIESLHRQYRKVTKSKSIYPNDDALMKSLYLATKDVEKKWTGRAREWNLVIGQLEIMFHDRLNPYL